VLFSSVFAGGAIEEDEWFKNVGVKKGVIQPYVRRTEERPGESVNGTGSVCVVGIAEQESNRLQLDTPRTKLAFADLEWKGPARS